MSATLTNMYRALRGSPVAFAGGAIIITSALMFVWKRGYEPYAAQKRRVEAESVAEFIFRREQQQASGLGYQDNETLSDR